MPQTFRDVFACHLYMLYSLMFLLESQQGGDGKVQESPDRQACVRAMALAAQTMADCRNTLWKRGVPDEAVVMLPCRIAYPLLERATGVIARKASCGDIALQILAVTVDSTDLVLSTVTAALMDLMHSYEHMAPLTAELCGMVSESPVNRLAVELIREMGRLDGSDAKANGVKNVAPFLNHLAATRPRLLLQHLSHILPHLQAESYNLRSAIVQTVTCILEYLCRKQCESDAVALDGSSVTTSQEGTADDISHHSDAADVKSRDALFDILAERVYDVSSYTRAATLKAWISMTSSGTLPKDRLLPVTKIAIDRLQDKTVVVRKQAMQV